MMQLRNRKIDTASGVAQDKVTRVRNLGRGLRKTSERQSPKATSDVSSAGPDLTTTCNQTAESVLPVSIATTKAGKPRKLASWTLEMNKNILRIYYTATKLETDKTMYRNKMYEQFKAMYPSMNITVQRIADQYRSIIVNNMIPTPVIEQIKKEVSETLGNQQCSENTIEPSEVIIDNGDNYENTSDVNRTKNDVNNVIDKLEQMLINEFNIAVIEFSGMNPANRHIIPKQLTSAKLDKITAVLNTKILPDVIVDANFEKLHTTIYCAAVAAIRTNGSKTKSKSQGNNSIKQKPHWELRISKKIEEVRCKLGRLNQYKNGNKSKKLAKDVQKIFKNTAVHTKYEPQNKHVEDHIDTLKQRLSVLVNRLRNYKEANMRKHQNEQFKNNEKMFYRNLTKTETVNNGAPAKDAIQQYWKSLWSNQVEHNKDAAWITSEIDSVKDVQEMTAEHFTLNDVKSAINSTHNWKATGIDNIHNYWYKKFTCVHEQLTKQLNDLIEHPEEMPEFLTQGITYMLPKTEDTKNPAKYRPITCLPTIYKILTACITNQIYKYCEEKGIMTEQQKGCRRNAQGCKEQLIIDSVMLEQAYKSNRSIYVTYIDYKKAFDSVPHSWLIHVLEIYKIDKRLVRFLKHIITTWKTTAKVQINNSCTTTEPIQIRRGIFQGDSLSPLWFCLALNPLSKMLNNTKYGFNVKNGTNSQYKLSHLMYMDDIKLYASAKTKLQILTQLTETFSKDIGMEFGLDKCKTQCIDRGKQSCAEFELQNGEKIEAMAEKETYKYLGVQQGRRIEHKKIKSDLKNAYNQRIRNVLKTKLNAKNITKAINTFAVPILTYSFGVIKWSSTELEEIQRKTRVLMTKNGMHHPKSAVERTTLPRNEGGRGLVDIKNIHDEQVKRLFQYFQTKQNETELHKAIVKADKGHTPLNMSKPAEELPESDCNNIQTKLNSWAKKTIHGRHYHELEEPYMDKEASNAWLKYGDHSPKIEGLMIAIQDQVMCTRNYRKYIMRDSSVEDVCRQCHKSGETIQHITAGCVAITQTEYKQRHDQVAKIIHQKLAMNHKLLTQKEKYFLYKPRAVLENDTHMIYWDRTIMTSIEIQHNRPDITLIDKVQKTTYLVDIAVPNSNNVQKTCEEKKRKYTELANEIKKQWKMNKVVVVPIVISATGLVPKTIHNSLQILEIDKNGYIELQKSVIYSTCHIVRKFLNIQ